MNVGSGGEGRAAVEGGTRKLLPNNETARGRRETTQRRERVRSRCCETQPWSRRGWRSRVAAGSAKLVARLGAIAQGALRGLALSHRSTQPLHNGLRHANRPLRPCTYRIGQFGATPGRLGGAAHAVDCTKWTRESSISSCTCDRRHFKRAILQASVLVPLP